MKPIDTSILTMGEIVSKINNLEGLVSEKERNPPSDGRYMASYETAIRDAKMEVEILKSVYKKIVPHKIEAVLISGPGEESALAEFEKHKIVTINAQNIYKDAAARSEQRFGKGFSIESFMELAATVTALGKQLDVRVPVVLQYDQNVPSDFNTEQAFRHIARNQIGGSGIESSGVLLEAMNRALDAGVAVDYTPVVVYNTQGIGAALYKDMFASTHEYSLEKGDSVEVKKVLRDLRSKLKEQGKLTNERNEGKE